MDSVAPVCVFVESHCEFALPCACLSFWQEIAFRSYVREGRSSGRSEVSFVHIKVLYELNTCPSVRSSISTLAVLPQKPLTDSATEAVSQPVPLTWSLRSHLAKCFSDRWRR